MADTGAVNPFPGYRPFGEADAAWYCGREREADALDARLATARVLAVVGPAEHGKSSLVRAGVIPRVRQRGGRVAVLRPGEDPIGNLARALSAPEALGLPIDELHRMLQPGPGGLAACVRAAHLPSGQDLLVVVDQLDELFRYRRCRERLGTALDDERFVALLLGADREESGVRILCALRAETVEECRAYPALYQAVRREPFELPAMTGDQLRRAIEAPIASAGGRVSREFVDTVVRAFEPTRVPSQLPLIQHALMRAWDARVRTDAELDVRHLEAVGGVPQALFTHADKVCADDPQPELVDKVVRCITTHADGHFVPRPASIGEIARMCDAGVEAIEGVVRRLQAPGVTFLKPPATGTLSATSVADISYDSFAWIRRHRWSYQAIPGVRDSRGRAVRPAIGVHPHVAAAAYNWRRYLWPALLALTTLMVMVLVYPPGPPPDTDPSPPRPIVLPACASGQMLVTLGDGGFDCAPKPACTAEQILVSGGDGGALHCEPPPVPSTALPSCSEGQILLGLGGDQFECVTPPPCPSGQIAYGQPNGPVRCLTQVSIELRVCGVGKILTGPGGGPFSCEEGSPPNINLHIGCPVVVGPTGGPVSCVNTPPPPPALFPCNVGEIQIGMGAGDFACVTQPPCREGQIAYGQADGPLLCMTLVIIERLVCGERSRLMGPVGDEFHCEPGARSNINLRSDLRIDCLILVGPAGGPLRCGPRRQPDPRGLTPPDLPSCSTGQILVGLGEGKFECVALPTCEPGQVLVGGGPGVAFSCDKWPPAPPNPCGIGQVQVDLGEGKSECRPLLGFTRLAPTCDKGEVLIAEGNGVFGCGSLPVLPSTANARCPEGQMLVGLGLKDGKADCRPVPPGPAVQFADLVGVERGFVYQLTADVPLPIPELGLRLRYCTRQCPPDGLSREPVLEVTDNPPKSRKPVSLLPPVPVPAPLGEFDVKFFHGGYDFLITLRPDLRVIVRRCAGGPCAK